MKILLVEDERKLADGLESILKQNNYSVDTLYDGLTGLDAALSGNYDLLLLDIMLPKLNGLDVLRNLRREKIAIPVLLLRAKSEIEDRINGLDCGADDYLTKPFDTGELLARIRALTRRRTENIELDGVNAGDLTLKQATQELCCGKVSVKLGHKEFQLMEVFMRNAHQILPRESLIERVWGYDDCPEYNHLDVYISFLRKKLLFLHTSSEIRTTKNVGYSLEEKRP